MGGFSFDEQIFMAYGEGNKNSCICYTPFMNDKEPTTRDLMASFDELMAFLQENMVIALEPKLIFPDRGVVGIENTHVVTRQGLRQLGQYPDEVTLVRTRY